MTSQSLEISVQNWGLSGPLIGPKRQMSGRFSVSGEREPRGDGGLREMNRTGGDIGSESGHLK